MSNSPTPYSEATPAHRLVKANHGIERARAREAKHTADRYAAVLELRAEGWTLQMIANLLGVTAQAVHKIIREGAKK